MSSGYRKDLFSKLVLSIICCLGLTFSNIAIAGVCDISGGSGIGGTGKSSSKNGGGIGGTGKPASKNGSGIGGTGVVAHGSGIGGTGKSASKNGSGIGGTGQTAQQTGFVVGTITGFGSICVNGIEIHYSASTPLQRDGQTVSPENALFIGQVVAVSVSGSGDEVVAEEMHILHAAIGPVSAINTQENEIKLLGQTVRFPADTGRPSGLDSIKKVQVGDYIEVSGLRHPNGKIIASHINEIAARPNVSLRGPISSISNNSFHIQGIKVNAPVPVGLAAGAKVEVSGRMGDAGLIPDNIALSQDRQLAAKVGGLVSIEGYLGDVTSRSTTEVAGRIIEIPAVLNRTISELSEQQKVIVTGRLIANDVIRMEHIRTDDYPIGIGHSARLPEARLHQQEDRDDTGGEHENDIQEDSNANTPEERHHKPEDHQKYEQPDNEKLEISTEPLEAPEAEEIELPEAEEIELPEVEEIELPEVEEIELPEIEEIELPEIEEIELPEIEEIELPEVEEIELPEIEEIELPEIEEIELPEIEEIELPEIEEIELPEIEEIELPEIEEIELPEIEEIELPEIEEIELPEIEEIELPEIEEIELPEIEEIEIPEVEEIET